eukprot:6951667-Prymnesium_polylepis.2
MKTKQNISFGTLPVGKPLSKQNTGVSFAMPQTSSQRAASQRAASQRAESQRAESQRGESQRGEAEPEATNEQARRSRVQHEVANIEDTALAS